MKSLEKEVLREILNKCWMTHDAMWFFHCMQECGIEKANIINKAAVQSMAIIEIKRIKKAFGIKKVETLEELKSLFEGLREVLECDFNKVNFSFSSNDVVRFELPNCFAYEGVKRLGLLDFYECGIFTRFEGWFEGLGIQYEATSSLEGCLMHTTGKCFRDYRLDI